MNSVCWKIGDLRKVRLKDLCLKAGRAGQGDGTNDIMVPAREDILWGMLNRTTCRGQRDNRSHAYMSSCVLVLCPSPMEDAGMIM